MTAEQAMKISAVENITVVLILNCPVTVSQGFQSWIPCNSQRDISLATRNVVKRNYHNNAVRKAGIMEEIQNSDFCNCEQCLG